MAAAEYTRSRVQGSRVLAVILIIRDPDSEVLGPVTSGVGDPAERGVSVHPGHIGEDRAGEISGEGDQCPVARGANQDAVPVEFLGHAVRRDRLARDHAREEPLRTWVGSRELRPQLGLFGKLPKELGEPRRQQDGVLGMEGTVSSRVSRRLVVHCRK